MRSILRVLAAVVCAGVLAQEVPASRAPQWQEVEDAINKGLPKTAIEKLEPIIAAALKEKAWGEAVKGIGRRIVLEGNIQGNKPEEKITRMEAEIAKAPAAVKPILRALEANWYWHYFQQNRWRFTQRTRTEAAPGKDFTTWDLPRLLAEIDKQFTLALAEEKLLKATPVADYKDLLEAGSVGANYRPTMFDIVTGNALDFYSAGEQAGAKAEDTFELLADSPIFAPVQEFLEWKPDTTDTESPTLKAIALYQNLLTFRLNDMDPTALGDADRCRLRLGHNRATGEGKADRYKAALERLAADYADIEVGALVLHDWAQQLWGEGDAPQAHQLAKRGAGAYPQSVGGKLCSNLVLTIEQRECQLTAERVWNAPWPDLIISYRNISKVYFRAVACDFEARLGKRRWAPEQVQHDERDALLKQAPALSWSADVPPTPDFRNRQERQPVPKELKPGFYFVFASGNETFAANNNQLSAVGVWVTDLALVDRIRDGKSVLEGMLLNAITGEPVADAAVKGWCWEGDSYKATPEAKTDANGLFRLEQAGTNYRQYLVMARKGDQALASGQSYYLYAGGEPSKVSVRTVFFTDRALYRPGQTIQFKGICYRADIGTDTYEILPNRDATVQFMDPNHKEVAKLQVRTNDYGSFSGSFTAPRDRVMGQMQIMIQNEGSSWFNVEEYKRPKFEVKLEKPKEGLKLGAEVKVTGKATAYTGAAIDGAKVNYRVVRNVQYPDWWYWRCWWYWYGNNNATQEIAHGITKTAVDGSFDVTFTAKPTADAVEKDEPVFRYTVYADVTDTAGETRSGSQTVAIGFTVMRATLGAGPWQVTGKPVEMTVVTQTHDGEPQAAEGTVKIHVLKQPDRIVRASLFNRYDNYRRGGRAAQAPVAEAPDLADPKQWELAEVVVELPFKTAADGKTKLEAKLPAGIYRAMLETKDRFGKKVSAQLQLLVVDPAAKAFNVKLPNNLAAATWSLEPGAALTALWGTGYATGRAFVEIEQSDKILKSWWTAADRTQEVIEWPVTEALRGGFTLRITYVRENRAYLESRRVDVPWSNKKLSLKWERFVSKLGPAQKESWSAVVSGPDAKTAAGEFVAALYDASLDQYRMHNWQNGFGCFRTDYCRLRLQFENQPAQFQVLESRWHPGLQGVSLLYHRFPADMTTNFWSYGYMLNRRAAAKGLAAMPGAAMEQRARGDMDAAAPGGIAYAMETKMEMEVGAAGGRDEMAKDGAKRKLSAGGGSDKKQNAPAEPGKPEGQGAGGDVDLSKVTARRNLNETAFFFPHLTAGADGTVRMEFTMPEALTQWKFLGFAHDRELRAGLLTDTAVTAKDLMVQPNPPRFVREGDALEFTVKVTNLSAARQTGKVRLTFADARTLAAADVKLGNIKPELTFDIPAAESRTFSWRLSVPDGAEFLTYKAVGATDRLSDGEEGYLPVLSRRILVQEALPLPIRNAGTKKFEFTKLLNSGKSKTLEHQSLTVQMVSQPAWYAVMALPYLMEYPHECCEQTFNRLYANALARFIANADPKIRNVFDQWKGTPALDSPMEKNQDLKSVMLEETPWYQNAKAESAARRDVGILFDGNRLNDETARTLAKLKDAQLGNGLWPWFPGGYGNEYITLYITTGFGRMRHLGVDIETACAVKSLDRLDSWIDEIYQEILRQGHPEDNHLTSLIAFYLYGRSFFLKDKPVAKNAQPAVDYFLGQARKYWLALNCRQSQGHLALALKRFGDKETPQAIMKSVKERSVSNEEMGMFWRDLEFSWFWYRAPIETQAIMIEAFDEVMGDAAAVEDCKVWLLKQKQTQDWKTTKATADAIYGLLLRGTNLLASDALVEVALAGKAIKPEKVEAGTGFYEQRFTRGEIKPDMGSITLKKSDAGVSWGSVHWQYLEDMTKVTPYEGTPLKLKKTLFIKENTKKGPELKAVQGALAVGDELVVRVELRTDRDMEYVHLKDQRGSGTEPVNVLSRWKYQDGLAYYESTRDTASHFFIEYLPKGVYVFEYSTRIVHKGSYQTGIASIQCMYAPEFGSHSESFTLEVK